MKGPAPSCSNRSKRPRRGARRFWARSLGSGSSAVMDARGVGDLRAATRSCLRQTLRSAGLDPGRGRATCTRMASRPAGRTRPRPRRSTKCSPIGRPGAGGGRQELPGQRRGGLRSDGGDRQRAGPRNTIGSFPVLNYETPDEQCPVQVVTIDGRPGRRPVRQSQRDAAGAGQCRGGSPVRVTTAIGTNPRSDVPGRRGGASTAVVRRSLPQRASAT